MSVMITDTGYRQIFNYQTLIPPFYPTTRRIINFIAFSWKSESKYNGRKNNNFKDRITIKSVWPLYGAILVMTIKCQMDTHSMTLNNWYQMLSVSLSIPEFYYYGNLYPKVNDDDPNTYDTAFQSTSKPWNKRYSGFLHNSWWNFGLLPAEWWMMGGWVVKSREWMLWI